MVPARPSRGGPGRGGGWSFRAPLWRWRDGTWHFVTVPPDVSDEVDEAVGDSAGGFGAVRVEVTVGGTVWRTSLFPSAEQAAYVLPVKRAVRVAEGVGEGDDLDVAVRLVDR